MKTPEQIKQWLQTQPWYDEFKEKVMDGNDISYNSKMNILNGKRGVYNIHEAIGSPDYDSEKWWARINEFSLWFCSNETITFDVLLKGRFVCTMRMPFCPLFPLTTEEIRGFVESKRPSLRGKDYKIIF